jgi:hypothetical protein
MCNDATLVHRLPRGGFPRTASIREFPIPAGDSSETPAQGKKKEGSAAASLVLPVCPSLCDQAAEYEMLAQVRQHWETAVASCQALIS